MIKTLHRPLAFIAAFILIVSSACNLTFGGGKTVTDEPRPLVVTASPENEAMISVEREPEPQALQIASAATALALNQYIYARLKTEELLSADIGSMTVEEFQKLMDDLVLTWETTDTLLSDAEEIVDQSLSVLESPAFNQTGFVQPSAQAMSLAAMRMDYVQPKTQLISFDAKSLDTALAADDGREFDPETWAENLSKQYDTLRGGQRYKQLAQQLGVDTKTAVEQMRLAQKIMHNIADLEEFRAEDGAYTNSIKIVQGYKTVSKVGMFVTATIATGGGSLATLGASSLTLGQAGAVVVGGVDCIVDVAATSSTIILGENHQVTTDIGNIMNKLAPISAVVGLVTFNAGETGEQLAYIGESLTEWYYNNKILGISVSGTDDGGTKVSALPIDVSGRDEAGVRSELKKAGFSTPDEGDETLSSIIEEYRINIEAATSKLVTLAAEMAAIMGEFNILVPQPDVVTIKNISGLYNGTATVTKATNDSLGTVTEMTLRFVQNDNGTATLNNNVGTYDPNTGEFDLEYGFLWHLTFSLEEGTIVAKGTMTSHEVGEGFTQEVVLDLQRTGD